MTTITIAKIGTNQTVNYAVDELVRLIRAIDSRVFVDQRTYDSYDSEKPLLWVGKTDLVTPSESDDEILIDVKNGAGVITGANNRAVLIAVYRFMRELGCDWIRPGADGEVIPHFSVTEASLTVRVHETPSYRHRGICIEGSLGTEHIINMIEWVPRVGMNIYFVQNFYPVGFFRRWYSRLHNPFEEGVNLTNDDFIHIWRRCEEEVLKRSLIYHGVGHGWTYHSFGIPRDLKTDDDPRITDRYRSYMAMINGERRLDSRGIDGTQLCYSNPEVRSCIINMIADYCKEHPAMDVVHFWLADHANNNCECEECKKHRPSDYYVMMLNELDKKMDAAGLETKIVFLVYVDLLWEPVDFKIENSDRFLLMFAPISRTYTSALCDFERMKKEDIPPYVRNRLQLPKSVPQNVAHLAAWQEMFTGDGFIFDYHLMWDHFLDPGYMTCAKVLHRDMANLDSLGLNGSVSCQQQRCAFPTGLPNYAMAAALWNKEEAFENISARYFKAAFGEDGAAVEDYLAKISELFDSSFMRNDHPEAHRDVLTRMAQIDSLTKVFEMSHITPNRDKSASWNYLYYHAEYCRMYAELIRRYTYGDEAKIKEQTDAFTAFVFALEPELHTVFDTAYFDEVYQRWIKRVYANKPTETVDF